MKLFLIAAAALTAFTAPAAMAQSHGGRGGGGGMHAGQRYDSYGYNQRWDAPRYRGQYRDMRRGDHRYENRRGHGQRRGHGRPSGHRGW